MALTPEEIFRRSRDDLQKLAALLRNLSGESEEGRALVAILNLVDNLIHTDNALLEAYEERLQQIERRIGLRA